MATTESIKAHEKLHAIVLELHTFAQVANDLAGERRGAPQWPYLLLEHTYRLTEACETLEMALRVRKPVKAAQ